MHMRMTRKGVIMFFFTMLIVIGWLGWLENQHYNEYFDELNHAYVIVMEREKGHHRSIWLIHNKCPGQELANAICSCDTSTTGSFCYIWLMRKFYFFKHLLSGFTPLQREIALVQSFSGDPFRSFRSSRASYYKLRHSWISKLNT